MWWKRGSAAPASFGLTGTNVFDFDLKVKRVFRFNSNDLMFSVENNDSTQALEYVFGIRVLYIRPG